MTLFRQFIQHQRQSKTKAQLIILVFFLGITVVNTPILLEELRRIDSYRKILDHNIIGYQFKGLNERIPKDTKYVSYFTDGPLEGKRLKMYTQAQFALIPAILDTTDFTHDYIIIVSMEPKVVLTLLQQYGLTPIAVNTQHGVVLAQRQ